MEYIFRWNIYVQDSQVFIQVTQLGNISWRIVLIEKWSIDIYPISITGSLLFSVIVWNYLPLYNVTCRIWMLNARHLSDGDMACVSLRWELVRSDKLNIIQSWLQQVNNTLLWRHNEPDGVSNHQPRDCLLNRLFGHRSKKTSKLRVTGLCAGNSPETGEFPAHKWPVTRKMFPFDDVIMESPSILWRRWYYVSSMMKLLTFP